MSGGNISIGASAGKYSHRFSFSSIQFGKQDNNACILRSLEISWWPQALLQGKVHIEKIMLDGFYMKASQKKESGKEDDEYSSFPHFLQPMPIVLEELKATDIFYDRGVSEDGSPQTSYKFDQVELSVTADSSGLTLKRLVAEGPDMAANLHGGLEFSQDPQVELAGTLRFAGFGFHSMTGDLALTGDVENPDIAVTLKTPATIVAKGKLHNLSTDPSWEAVLFTENLDLSTWIRKCPQIIIENGSASMHGGFLDYHGHALFKGRWGRFDILELEGDLDGNENFIDFPTLELRRKDAVIKAENAWISWQKIFDWKGAFAARNIDSALFSSSLSGKFDAQFYSRGEVFDKDVEALFSEVKLQGELHDQPVSLNGNLLLHQDWLYTERVEVQSGLVEGKAILGPAKVDWGDELGWSTHLLLQKFNPAFFLSDFPGQINGEIESHGQFATDKKPLSATLDIRNLAGHLKGCKFFGLGGFVYTDSLFSSEGFTLRLGASTFDLREGRIAENKDSISFVAEFHSPSLNEIFPHAEGALDIVASAHGAKKHPDVAVQFEGDTLAFQEYSLKRAKGDLHLQLSPKGRTMGRLQATGIEHGKLYFDDFKVQLDGKMNAHSIDVALASKKPAFPLITAVANASGGFSFEKKKWAGVLRKSRLNLDEYGAWQQQGKAPLLIAENLVSLGDFALQSRLGKITTNFSLQHTEYWLWQGSLELVDMELDRLCLLFDAPVVARGEVQGSLFADGFGAVPEHGSLNLLLPEMFLELNQLSSLVKPLQLKNGCLTGKLQDGQLQITGGWDERSGGKLKYNAQLLGVNDLSITFSDDFFSHLPISGAVSLKGVDVAMLGNFLSYGQPFGKINSDFSFGGFVDNPQLTGEISLAGGIGLLSQGISLKNPAISLDLHGKKMDVQGEALSGDGFARVNGLLEYNNGVSGKFHLTGQNFLAVDQPEYSFVVNPDLRFLFDQHKGELTGEVDVVSGVIEPRNFSDKISASDDVVIVEKGEKDLSDWLFSLDLGVDFGEGVAINGYGLSGDILGKLNVKMAPEELISGTGTLKLENGKFSMYGRSLDITRGNIIFSGGPVDNPGVDVRAEKSMSAQQALSEGYTVGVDISGLAQNLQYRLFSSPPMSETEILSYMILGHSLAGTNAGDESILVAAADTLGLKGGGAVFGELGKLFSFDDVHLEGSAKKEDISLVVGKRLSKNIYVGYDVNMYSQLGQFWVRYELGKGFSVQTFSSSESTGADLLFSFEK